MQLGLKGKVALVTGGTRGIGRACVEGFLEEGSAVHFCARTSADVEKASEDLRSKYAGATVSGHIVDVADGAAVKSWVESVASSHEGRIDVVVANVSALAIPNTPENWQASFEVDVFSVYKLVEAALPFVEKSKGNVIAISSVTGRDIDFTAPSPYGAMKAALIHYMAQLAHKLAPKGVRANTVSPGNTYFEGGVWAGMEQNSRAVFDEQLRLNPTGKMGTPQEVADAVVFLASERASRISGTNLLVDGALCTGVQF